MKLSEVFNKEWKSRKAMINFGASFSSSSSSSTKISPSPNWVNIYYDIDYKTAVQQIQGITQPIILELSIDNSTKIVIYYRIDTSAPYWTNGGIEWDGNNSGWTTVSSFPVTFSVSNGNYVSFACDTDGFDVTRTLTVKNNSDGAVVIDSFTATITERP